MRRRKNGSGRIDFGMKTSSGIGIVSSCMVAAEALLTLGAVYLSYLKHGEGGVWLGAAGFAVFVLSVVGLVMSIWGLFRKGYYHGTDWFGALGNGVFFLGSCGLFIWGTMV